jgi:1-acyl-sn-glycerol-3-phosphate acyltransferase
MSATALRVDHLTIQERVQDIAQQLLDELGSHRGLEEIRSAAHAESVQALHLERDLGLGSLERVELIVRAGDAFHIRPPDELFAEANTVGDVIAALELQLGQARPGAITDVHTRFAGRENAATAAELGLESAETLLDVLRRRARAEPTRLHLRLREDNGEIKEITYGALFDQVTLFARGMENLGVAPGDRVAILLPTCADFFHVLLGAQMAAAVPVPIYPPVRADRIEEYAARQAAILRSAEVSTIITFGRAERVARLLEPQVPSLRRVHTAAQVADLGTRPGQLSSVRRVSGSDIAFLQYTSGSTGDPKGVTLTHANLLANLRAILAVVTMNPADRGVSWLPLYHDMGLIGAWMGPMYAGAPLSLMSPLAFLSRPERWLWAIHEHRGTVTAAPNFAYELCVRKVPDERIAGLDLSSMRYMLNGAEPVNPSTLERFAARFERYGFDRRALMPVYGLAENSVAVSFTPPMRGWRVDWLDRAALENDGRAVPVPAPSNGAAGRSDPAGADPAVVGFVSAGFPIPGNEVRIVDDAGNDVAERVEGRLWFRSPSSTSGYYRNPAATAAMVREGGWLDSGDRAYFADAEIFITGRAKDIIIKAGRNLYPHEIEELAAGVPGVRKGCVVAFGAVDQSSGTERLVVVAETAERDPARREEIAARIRERVAEGVGMPPDDVEMVPAGAVPKTSSGKLRREATRALFREGRLHQGRPPAWLQVSRLAARSAPKQVAGLVRRTIEAMYGVYFLVMVSLLAMVVWAELILMPSRPIGARISRALNRLFFRLVGVPLELTGEEHLEALATRWGQELRGGLLIVCNHASYTDAVVLLALLGAYRYRFVAKQEVMSYPFIGGILKRLGHFSFVRENREARLKQADALEEALVRGETILIFPEGTFTPAPGLRPFQLGAFKSAVASGCPVLPIALRGTRQLLPDEAALAKPSRVTLTVCPPIYPSNDGWQAILRLRDATRDAIAEHCGEPMV